MRAFEEPTSQGQSSRLRRLAESALRLYGLEPNSLKLLTHLENTTFRVDARGRRYLLRIHRVSGSPVHPPRSLADVTSEMAWLDALRHGAQLAVPEAVPTIDGGMVAVVEGEGLPSPRLCALFHWAKGRFLDASLTPSHLERVGELSAQLHNHAQDFLPPRAFRRWRVGDPSDGVRAWVSEVVGEHLGSDASAIADAAMRAVQEVRRELGVGPEAFGLIHADLHQENYLFDGAAIRAIDFDDCGWGHYLYDLAVTVSELSGRPDYDDLRAGLLRGYPFVHCRTTMSASSRSSKACGSSS
jgi:Ser/Thr protein kinase RdoA (MazF antagonist)